jgi:predicted ABC-type ATPase
MNERPKVVVIAGPNGAGKSTTAPAIVRQAFGIHEFVNADVIARGLSEFAPETVAVTAGRVMPRRAAGGLCFRDDTCEPHVQDAAARHATRRL